jgi:pyruvate dehydrogenase E1 component alpha subunit
MGTRLDRAQSQIDLASKARSYLLPAEPVDAMDVLAVEAAVGRLAEQVRAGLGPAFVELRTYRFRAHSMFDAELYREKAEVELWKTRDPIEILHARLIRAQLASEAALAEIENAVAGEVADAVAFAEAGTWEPVDDLLKDVSTPPAAMAAGTKAVAS